MSFEMLAEVQRLAGVQSSSAAFFPELASFCQEKVAFLELLLVPQKQIIALPRRTIAE
jgi:hypothetical protein